jgi:predicted phage tail protein
MRTILIIAAALFIAFTGCVTMPDPVPDPYLADKSAEDAKTIDKLTGDIIAKNHEIKGMRNKVKETDHALEVEKGRLSILQEERKLLFEKKKQFVLENDQARIDENKKMIFDKDNEIDSQNARVEYTATLLEHTAFRNEVLESELAVLIAQLNFEKARIAKAYLLKREEASGEDGKKQKKGEALTYDEKYLKYLDKQRESLASQKNDLEKLAVKLKMAEEKLKK